jgi:hypothetical protein
VVVFVRALEHVLMAIKEIFLIFGEASGMLVNYRKTTATLIRGEEGDDIRFEAILG